MKLAGLELNILIFQHLEPKNIVIYYKSKWCTLLQLYTQYVKNKFVTQELNSKTIKHFLLKYFIESY